MTKLRVLQVGSHCQLFERKRSHTCDREKFNGCRLVATVADCYLLFIPPPSLPCRVCSLLGRLLVCFDRSRQEKRQPWCR